MTQRHVEGVVATLDVAPRGDGHPARAIVVERRALSGVGLGRAGDELPTTGLRWSGDLALDEVDARAAILQGSSTERASTPSPRPTRTGEAGASSGDAAEHQHVTVAGWDQQPEDELGETSPGRK